MNENTLQEMDNWHQQYQKIQQNIQQKITQLKTTIKNQNDTIHTLQNQVKDLKSQENFKEKYDEAQDHLAKEKERLEKLYHKYWETENESEKIRTELQNWHTWFDQNKDIFDKVFTAAPAQLKPKEETKAQTTSKQDKKEEPAPIKSTSIIQSTRRRIKLRR